MNWTTSILAGGEGVGPIVQRQLPATSMLTAIRSTHVAANDDNVSFTILAPAMSAGSLTRRFASPKSSAQRNAKQGLTIASKPRSAAAAKGARD